MARIRTIKPEFFTSEDIVDLSPLARLLYVALWCEADREGRMEWKPRTFKMRYLPGDDCDIGALCGELTGAGLVVTYMAAGKVFGEIPTFLEHQAINNRERESEIPPRVATPLSRVSDASGTRESGREGKGKEGKEDGGADAPSEQVFSGDVIRIDHSQADKWRKSFPSINLFAELQAADAYYRDNPPKGGKWFFPVANWLKRAEEAKSKPPSRKAPGSMSPDVLEEIETWA